MGEVETGAFSKRVAEIARWSDAHEIAGLLIYTGNASIDPWLTAKLVIDNSDRCIPLVAVQPIYMHPFAVAQMISSIGCLTSRPIHLNMVTGGFSGDLTSLNDSLDHDARYDRLTEYGLVIKELLTSVRRVKFAGDHYKLNLAALAQRLDPQLLPRYFVAGSSAACVKTAQNLQATRLSYCGPPDEYTGAEAGKLAGCGIRVGVIARDSSEEAWRVATERFPVDQLGEELHDMASLVSESAWHGEMSDRARGRERTGSAYWLYPFRAYKTFCPYLVGTYEEVIQVLARYIALGVTTLILDFPHEEEDFYHANKCIDAAARQTVLIRNGIDPARGSHCGLIDDGKGPLRMASSTDRTCCPTP